MVMMMKVTITKMMMAPTDDDGDHDAYIVNDDCDLSHLLPTLRSAHISTQSVSKVHQGPRPTILPSLYQAESALL